MAGAEAVLATAPVAPDAAAPPRIAAAAMMMAMVLRFTVAPLLTDRVMCVTLRFAPVRGKMPHNQDMTKYRASRSGGGGN